MYAIMWMLVLCYIGMMMLCMLWFDAMDDWSSTYVFVLLEI